MEEMPTLLDLSFITTDTMVAGITKLEIKTEVTPWCSYKTGGSFTTSWTMKTTSSLMLMSWSLKH